MAKDHIICVYFSEQAAGYRHSCSKPLVTIIQLPLFVCAGAFGYFEVTHDISKYCKASLFSKVGKKTPIAARFSTVGEGTIPLCLIPAHV